MVEAAAAIENVTATGSTFYALTEFNRDNPSHGSSNGWTRIPQQLELTTLSESDPGSLRHAGLVSSESAEVRLYSLRRVFRRDWAHSSTMRAGRPGRRARHFVNGDHAKFANAPDPTRDPGPGPKAPRTPPARAGASATVLSSIHRRVRRGRRGAAAQHPVCPTNLNQAQRKVSMAARGPAPALARRAAKAGTRPSALSSQARRRGQPRRPPASAAVTRRASRGGPLGSPRTAGGCRSHDIPYRKEYRGPFLPYRKGPQQGPARRPV